MKAPRLVTQRLILREIVDDDLDELLTTFGNPDVTRYYLDVIDHATGWSREETASWISNNFHNWQQKGIGRWGVELSGTGRLVGAAGFNQIEWMPEVEPAVEVGFRLHPSVWGKGIAGEASIAALNFAFNDLNFSDVVAAHLLENVQSERAIKKIGFVYEQTLPYHSEISGRNGDFKFYRMTREMWAQRS